jgi:hypothetical protein
MLGWLLDQETRLDMQVLKGMLEGQPVECKHWGKRHFVLHNPVCHHPHPALGISTNYVLFASATALVNDAHNELHEL